MLSASDAEAVADRPAEHRSDRPVLGCAPQRRTDHCDELAFGLTR